jgi:hypothetical protein
MERGPGERGLHWGLHSRRKRFKKRPMKTANPREAGSRFLLAGILTVFSWLIIVSTHAASPTVKVEPRESDELLANPGMGWQTFHRFADNDPNLEGLPSASAYFRFYWREIESQDGQIDFPKFDDLLAHARRAGQKLAFRIMCTGSGAYMDVPPWLKEQGCRGVEFTYGGTKHWVPDFADPLFQEKHFRLVRELGRRYDQHPDLDVVDIGSVGLWGEWHMSGTEVVGTHRPVSLPSPEILQSIINAWCSAFPTANKVILIGSEVGMPQTAKGDFGWRADCLGDLGGFSKTWNHMDHFYLQQLARTGAENTWKRAPVAFESCWDMRKWKEAGWDVGFIFDYALRCHASYVNNKSAPIPDGTRPDIERFLRRLGYRLVIRSVAHEAKASAGAMTSVVIEWENAGVAPPYRDYRLAIRLRTIDGRGEPSVQVGETSIRGWLPGRHRTELSLQLPAELHAGRHEVAVGVVDPRDRQPAVRLANAGRDAEGWYRVSELDIVQ